MLVPSLACPASCAYCFGRQAAAEALVQIAAPAVESLIAAVRDQDSAALGQWQKFVAIGAPAVEPLVAILTHADTNDVRLAAAEALGKIGDPRAVEPLIEALSSTSRPIWNRSIHDDMSRVAAQALSPLASLPLCLSQVS